MQMTEQTCPSCGEDLPSEMGQHAENIEIGLVTCPHCGAKVTLDKGTGDTEGSAYETANAAPPGRAEGQDSFSGQETMADLAEEVAEKPT